MECRAEIFKRKVIQLMYEMDADFGGSGDIIAFPDGSHTRRYDFADDFGVMECWPDAEIHPPFVKEYTENVAREYIAE